MGLLKCQRSAWIGTEMPGWFVKNAKKIQLNAMSSQSQHRNDTLDNPSPSPSSSPASSPEKNNSDNSYNINKNSIYSNSEDIAGNNHHHNINISDNNDSTNDKAVKNKPDENKKG